MQTRVAAVFQEGSWYRGFIQGKTRIVFAWVFAAVLVVSAREYPTWPGIVICFLGAALRFWGSGFLEKDQKLSIGGPFAYTRNPLYVGTWVMAAGTALAIQQLWLVLALVASFTVVYHFIMRDEEKKLTRIFGAPYTRYCLQVPRFFPRLWPVNRDLLRAQLDTDPARLGRERFSWDLARHNRAHEAFVSFAALIGFVTLIAWFWKAYAGA